MSWFLSVGFWINLKYKELSLLIDCMFYDNPTTKKIIPAWSLNHSLKTIVSSFKNSTIRAVYLLLKTLFLTVLACGNRVSELTAITREDLAFTVNHVIFPTKSNYLHKN